MDDIFQIPYGQPTKMSIYIPETLSPQKMVKADIPPNHESVKVSFKCPAHYKKEFKDSHCALIISVGQTVHEGEVFLSTIRLVNSAFKECTILVDDSLQRHTLAMNNDAGEESMYQLSMEIGDRWIEESQKFFDEFTIPYNIVRWDHWLKLNEYSKQRTAVNYLYATDRQVADAFHMAAHKFLDRYIARLDRDIDYDRAFNLCLEYLQEECAVMYLKAQAGYHFDIYPRRRNLAMAITYIRLVRPYFPGMLRAVSLSIKT
jgi:hypothetical protein